MRHFSEDELARYAFGEGCDEGAEIEAHVSECPACSATLTFVRSIDSGFNDQDVWKIVDPENAERREAYRRLAAEVAAEDREAEELLGELLRVPGRVAWTNLAGHKRYRTAGVVRRLLRASNEASERDPLEALTFADSAIEIAEALSGYPELVTGELRGNAWIEQANALRLLGRYDAALDALTRADHIFRKLAAAPIGAASAKYVRAGVHYERQDYGRAAQLAEESGKAFEEIGETERYMKSRHLLANIDCVNRNLPEAQRIYADILTWAEGAGDSRWIAREHNTLGRVALERRDLPAAEAHFRRSRTEFERLGLAAEGLRPAWGLALVAVTSGDIEGAFSQFEEVRSSFHARGMLIDEALVALDSMDALHASKRLPEIVMLAREIMQTFVAAGMHTSALQAFAYLKDAARRKKIDIPDIAHVRRFMERTRREPSLIFVPPN